MRARRWLSGILIAAGLVCAASCRHTPFDDISITAVEVAQAPRLDYLHAQAGMKFLQVKFQFENKGKAPLILKALDFSLRDVSGRLHPFSAQVLDMGQPKHVAEVRIGPEELLPGSVVFQIPSAARPAEMIFRQNLEGGLAIKL